jgi:hypothetical protein
MDLYVGNSGTMQSILLDFLIHHIRIENSGPVCPINTVKQVPERSPRATLDYKQPSIDQLYVTKKYELSWLGYSLILDMADSGSPTCKGRMHDLSRFSLELFRQEVHYCTSPYDRWATLCSRAVA